MNIWPLYKPASPSPLMGQGVHQRLQKGIVPGTATQPWQRHICYSLPCIIMLSLLLCSPILYAADTPSQPIGKLFFTPAERASLDTIRRNSKAPDRVIKAEDTATEAETDIEAAAPEKPAPVTFNGYVSRSDGKNTVWVNNRATLEKNAVGNVNVGKLQATKRQVQVSVSGSNKAVNLKPGQIYDPASDTVYNYLKDVPVREDAAEEEGGVVDKIGDKLSAGVDEVKKKISGLVDLIKPKSDRTQSGDK